MGNKLNGHKSTKLTFNVRRFAVIYNVFVHEYRNTFLYVEDTSSLTLYSSVTFIVAIQNNCRNADIKTFFPNHPVTMNCDILK